jgi:hypothetical protein
MEYKTLVITCNLVYVLGHSSIYIQMPKTVKRNSRITYELTKVLNLINEHIEGKYLKTNRSKYSNLKFVEAIDFDQKMIYIPFVYAKDYQKLVFDILNLLTSNDYKLVFKENFYESNYFPKL